MVSIGLSDSSTFVYTGVTLWQRIRAKNRSMTTSYYSLLLLRFLLLRFDFIDFKIETSSKSIVASELEGREPEFILKLSGSKIERPSSLVNSDIIFVFLRDISFS
jgi:hypothetical protein